MEAIFEAYSDFIPDFDLFQEALRSPLPTHLRINLLKGEPAEIVRSLEKSRTCLERSFAGNETLYVARGLDSQRRNLESSRRGRRTPAGFGS